MSPKVLRILQGTIFLVFSIVVLIMGHGFLTHDHEPPWWFSLTVYLTCAFAFLNRATDLYRDEE